MNTDIKDNLDTPISNAAIIYPAGDYYDDKVLLEDMRKLERLYNDAKQRLGIIERFADKSNDELRLIAGELTAQEIRTFRALFGAAIRSSNGN